MLRRGICLAVLGALLVHLCFGCGCYSREIVPVDSVDRIVEADRVFITTTDEKIYELTHVQIKPPWLAGLLPQKVGEPAQQVTLNINDIKEITIEKDDPGSTMLGLGAGCCGALVVAMMVALARKESCPFIYAYDGADFKLEGELYSGAVFKAIERKDYLRLHSLDPVNGRCLLKLSNEAHETQQTDELLLLAVDHPSETDVVADRNGKMCVLSDPLPPVFAESFGGEDVTQALISADSLFWVTNPLLKDPNESADLKDGVILRFEKPEDADSLQLAVRIGNTYWADYIFGRYTALYGYLIDGWYEAGTEDRSLRKKAERFMRENGLALNVDLLVEEEWEDLGYFYPTGPIALQDDVIEFDVPVSNSDTLMVRLEGGSYFWMIDYVAIDRAGDPAVEILKLSPVEAADEKRSDLRDVLTESDDRYYTMPEVGNYAIVTYPVPPSKSDKKRTFIVQSEGYYTIHRKKGRMPNVFALAGIRQGSEGFLQYSLKEFWRVYRFQSDAHPD